MMALENERSDANIGIGSYQNIIVDYQYRLRAVTLGNAA